MAGPLTDPAPSTATPARADLPTGTVTFVFTDIEGSTKLAHELGTDRWGEILAQHAAVVREALAGRDGVVVRTEGDAFFLAFRTTHDAVAAAAAAQRGFAAQRWAHDAAVRVRIGMHTGENARPGTTADAADYVGYDVHRAARVASAAHGGQVLVSSVTRMLLGDRLPEGLTLRDLGAHRLKDLPEPDRLFQVVIDGLPSEFGPLRTLSAVTNNLPTHVTSFIGRERELAEARELLDRARLLTLIGPGGTGKTRLSLELAERAMDAFPDGVWFVRLAAVSDPALVPSAIAQTLGLVVPAGRTPLEHLVDHLRDRQALLVIDNFEQVVAAAADVGAIVQGCPRTKLIVSTRIALRIAGEQEYPVPPLTLPDPEDVPDVEDLARSEAIQLFVERARATKPSFALTPQNARAVVGIVAQLDGLPLAIELAAARVKVLEPQAILERLAAGLGLLQSSSRDAPARQATLRGAIGWSYDLLDDGLKRLFSRLAVFRGGGALEQIEAVCGPAGEIGREVLDGVAELVDHSLVRPAGGDTRFLMLETIREFAREKLDQGDEAAEVDLRHARAYLALAQSMAPDLLGGRQKELLDRFEQEIGNLRVALDICSHLGCADQAACDCAPEDHVADEARVEISLRLVSALWRFWHMRGHIAEGRQRTERILALPGAEAHREAYLAALEGAGGLTYWQGDLEATGRTYTKRLELARETADPVAVANALYDLSFVYTVSGDEIPRGQALLEEALALFRAAGDRGGVARSQWAISSNAVALGNWQRSAELLPEVIATFEAMGNRFQLAWAYHNLGITNVRLGAFDAARAAFSDALSLFRESGDVSAFVLLIYDFAELAAAQGRTDRALRLYGAGLHEQERTGTAIAEVWSGGATPFVIALRALLDATPADVGDPLKAEGAALTSEQALAFALSDDDAPEAVAAP